MTFWPGGSRTVRSGLPCYLRSTNGPFSTAAPDLDAGSVNGAIGRRQYLSRIFVAPESNGARTARTFYAHSRCWSWEYRGPGGDESHGWRGRRHRVRSRSREGTGSSGEVGSESSRDADRCRPEESRYCDPFDVVRRHEEVRSRASRRPCRKDSRRSVKPDRSIEGERCREVSIHLDLRFEIGDLLLRSDNRISAGDQTARRRILASDRDERSRELRGVAGLPPVL